MWKLKSLKVKSFIIEFNCVDDALMNSPECSDTRIILGFKAIIFNFPVFIGFNEAVTGLKAVSLNA